MRFFAVLLVLAGCARGDKDRVYDGPPQDIDAAIDARIDAPMVDAPACPQPAASGPHLVLSEITLTPANGEFIEIFNPTHQAVNLSNYYLSDSGLYWQLPGNTPNLGASDFIVRFPPGSSIAPEGVLTVTTVAAATFMTQYGLAPMYSIADGGMMSVAANGTPTLTDAGEIVVLFTWDGASPLVQDVDIMIAGAPTAANTLVDKSQMTEHACRYAHDADTIASQASSPGNGKSTKRIALEGTSETHGGNGNGLTGDDETSEDTSTTWDTTATFTAPTPGMVPTALLQ